MFDTIGLIAKDGDQRVRDTVALLVHYLRAADKRILLDTHSAGAYRGDDVEVTAREVLGTACDLVIVVAGDGTFLNAARDLAESGVRLLGVNLGRLGFLADIMPAEMTDRLDEILQGNFQEEHRFLLDSAVIRDGETIHQASALNEVVAHKGNIPRLVEFETRVNNHLLNVQRSDGLIVSTPTGSTAYSLSGGGPIVHPALDAIVLVPICPHTLSSRPLVVTGDSEIQILMSHVSTPEAQLTCDGHSGIDLHLGDRIVIRKKPQSLHLIHPAGHDYFATLRTKLHWAREIS
jgi:NAD+ kinase